MTPSYLNAQHLTQIQRRDRDGISPFFPGACITVGDTTGRGWRSIQSTRTASRSPGDYRALEHRTIETPSM
jgi:hypothetical protein